MTKSLPESFQKLAEQSNDPEQFRIKVAEQLVKDFEMCGIDLQFEDHDAETIIEELTITVGSLIAHDSKRLVQFLYRVDLNERTLVNMLNVASEQDIAVPMSMMILEREGKKVMLRQRYSS
jgi:hypothetical protein